MASTCLQGLPQTRDRMAIKASSLQSSVIWTIWQGPLPMQMLQAEPQRPAAATATEVMAARPKPGSKLSQFLADLRLQKRQQDEQGHVEMPINKFQTVTLKGEVSKLAEDGEDDANSATTKAVKCFNIFNYDSWPEDQEELVDHGADDLAILLDHFSPVLTR
ncbi:unnamed protein product [Leuciscus chuanchicus]